VNVVGKGSVSLDPAGGTYADGAVVELTAAANAEWEFSGWSGDLSGTDKPESITMDGNKTVILPELFGPPSRTITAVVATAWPTTPALRSWNRSRTAGK
jgi:hypothetical protein